MKLLMDVDAIAAEVAAVVGLAEGEAGVRDVLRAVARYEPVPTSRISRIAELPVPIVTAVCNELRKRDLIDRGRPVRLSQRARELLADAGPAAADGCPDCDGTGVVIPAALTPLRHELDRLVGDGPPVRLELDQTHCTIETKLRRVLRLHQAGALDGARILLVGDDDLIAVAIAAFARQTGTARAIRRLAVVDTDQAVLDFIADRTAGSGVPVETIRHGLRDPLPPGLREAFDVACTDPPYTVPGAELFLDRAVSALERRPGQHVFFSFGARRPDEQLQAQRLIAGLGLTIRSLTPNFNAYAGAGILGGASHLYHLRSTGQTAPLLAGRYDGPLYTADTRAVRDRPYRCAGCAAVHNVGPGGQWPLIADLQRQGCPECGGTTFRPMPRQRR